MDTVYFIGDWTASIDCSITVDTETVAVSQYSWFANAYELWRYIIGSYNTTKPDTAKVTMNSDGTVLLSGFTTTSVYISVASGVASGIGDVLGIDGAANPQGSNQWLTGVISGFFAPAFPVVKYERGVEQWAGTTIRAEDGAIYSMRGFTQQYRTIELAFDYRDSDLTERTDWESLVTDYWLIGRSVTLYLDSTTLVSIPDDATSLVNAEVLVLGDSSGGFKFNRVVEFMDDAVMLGDSAKYYLRRHFPIYENQNVAYEVQ